MRNKIMHSHDALRAHSLTFTVLGFRRTTFFELAVYITTTNCWPENDIKSLLGW